MWSWVYANDAGMSSSVHHSPWPTLEELEAVPEPKNAETYAATVAVLEAVRKAKADANVSIKKSVEKVTITGRSATLEALAATRDDIARMLTIESMDFQEGDPETESVPVTTQLAE